MTFLIEYDRKGGRLVTFTPFEPAERRQAQEARLALELDLNRRGVLHEVVLLDADDETALRRTHRRYFATLRELAAELAS